MRAALPRPPGAAAGEVIAPLEAPLFRGTNYGLSVWVTWLIQVFWQRRPVRAFEREWADCGVRLPAAPLLGHVADMLTWFEPLEAPIGARQQQALCMHGDETSWVVHVWGEAGGNPRGWMWVCDRYGAYVKLAREHPGSSCPRYVGHVRRDYVKLGRSLVDLKEWVSAILERLGTLYRLNAERLAEWDPHKGARRSSRRRPKRRTSACKRSWTCCSPTRSGKCRH